MQKLLTRIVKAPLTYIADLRAITFKQYLHIHTNFSPSYPIMICTSLIFTLMLAGTILYFVFTNPLNSKCFDNAKGGAYIIAVLYPIESILCFICLTGTIALSKSKCWKILWILIFGPIVSGFGFGELGLVEMCALSSGQNQLIRTPAIVKRPGFIDAIVYLYISFFVMYFILVPSINYIYQRQQIDLKSKTKPKQQQKQKQNPKDTDKSIEDEKPKKSCCSKFITVLYYFLNTILVISVIFLLFIKILGPIIFTFLWIELAAHSQYMTSDIQRMILAFSILAYFAPLSLMIITIGIQRIFKLGKGKKDLPQAKQQDASEKRTIDLQQSQQGRITVSQRQSKTSKISKKQSSSMREQIQLDQEVNQPRASTGKSKVIKQALL